MAKKNSSRSRKLKKQKGVPFGAPFLCPELNGYFLFGYRNLVILSESAPEPVGAAGFAFLVTPGVVADIYAIVIFDPLTADIAVVLLEFFEEGLCVVEGLFLSGHRAVPLFARIPEEQGDCKQYLLVYVDFHFCVVG
ncbi:MAG TPA: hypothetical protein PLR60_16320 [Syntrophorhabdaceae bacterium]|nr:hypothetical protein [Syntrophorhabdaceae bacterium]